MSTSLMKFLIDLTLWVCGAGITYLFRKPNLVDSGIPQSVVIYLAISAGVMAVISWYYHLARQTWQHSGIPDLLILARACAIATLLLFAAGFVLQEWLKLPRTVPLVGGFWGSC
ncbi:hypothetical protein [Deinococcus cavernae]|uniref:hypothetical protein n=1 Tax=Deinococcus cavernae TaxID=2320857 RepID=UPI001F399DAE|nr:hypothetical protein [Deinococcus cavernae]